MLPVLLVSLRKFMYGFIGELLHAISKTSIVFLDMPVYELTSL
jgi:hypothetical protein